LTKLIHQLIQRHAPRKEIFKIIPFYFMKEKILIICVDRDNDLKKVKKSGPIIGREANIEAAKSLLLYDPEDTDGNAILLAVKTYDEVLKDKTKDPKIVTLTGHEDLGYKADKNVTKQLEKVLSEFPATSCVFVSDGADDDVLIPIISSRVKIISKRNLTMKQAKELESTWVLILNKLKEPYFAKIFFGVPGFLIVLFLASEYFGFGWRPVAGLLGVYLIVKAFGVDEIFLSSLKSLFAPELSSIIYVISFLLVLIGLIGGITKYYGSPSIEGFADGSRFFIIFVGISIVILFAGRVLNLFSYKKILELFSVSYSTLNMILICIIIYSALTWIYGDIWFYQFLLVSAGCVIFSLAFLEVFKKMKNNYISKLRIENKEIINEAGAYVGKVVGIDKDKNLLFVETPLGTKIQINFGSIVAIEEKIVIKEK
jgi:putative membrane protein